MGCPDGWCPHVLKWSTASAPLYPYASYDRSDQNRKHSNPTTLGPLSIAGFSAGGCIFGYILHNAEARLQAEYDAKTERLLEQKEKREKWLAERQAKLTN